MRTEGVRSISVKCFRLEIGFPSRITTASPTDAVFPGSCTRYFLLRRMYFLYFGCCTNRSTDTVTVSFIADFTTTPRRVLGAVCVSVIRLIGYTVRELSSVSNRAMSLRTPLPSLTFLVRLPAPPKRNTRSSSRFCAISLCKSATEYFFTSIFFAIRDL